MKKLILLRNISVAVITGFTVLSCQQAAKEAVKEGVEAVSEKGIINIARTGAKEATELSVIAGTKTAAKKNLIHSARLASSRLLLKDRNQFITHDQFVNWLTQPENKKRLLLGHPKSGSVLRENLRMVMGKDFDKFARQNPYEAHHLVGIDRRAPSTAISQKVLRKYAIDINDPMNGLILPRNKFSVYMGPIHRGGHTVAYNDLVKERLLKAKTREQCFAILDQIKKEIYTGKIPLYKAHNTNTVKSALVD